MIGLVRLVDVSSPLTSLHSVSVPLDEAVPGCADHRFSLQTQLKKELYENGFVKPDGRITQKIPAEVVPLNEEQFLAVKTAIFVPHGHLLGCIIGKMEGKLNAQLIGGVARDIFYKDLSYLHTILASLGIADPSVYDPLLLKYSLRKCPDTDIRFMLDPQDAMDMHFWGDLVSRMLVSKKLPDCKKDYFCGDDADHAVITFSTGKQHEVQLLFTNRLKRETLFKHELMLNVLDPLTEGFKFKLDLQQFWQASLDLLTRTLHVDKPEEVNFDGLPILISYYVRGWTLGDAHVESIFLDKFLRRVDSEGGIVRSFLIHFGKTLAKHHFSDPEAAMALAFNFCAAAKGRSDVDDRNLLTILRQFSVRISEDAHHLLRGIKKFIEIEEHGLEDLFNWVYTQAVLGRSKVAMLDHRDGKGFQLELPGKHEPLHLLIPGKYCSLSLKGSEKLFGEFEDSPLCMQAEELGVGAEGLWGEAEALLSAETKSPDKVMRGFGALILSQLWEPREEKVSLMLRYVPWMLSAQSEHEVRLVLMECVQKALGDSFPGLMVKVKSLMTQPFKMGDFIFEWIHTLADRRERLLRDISWELWNSVPLKSGKMRNKKAIELFESYFDCDMEKSFALFCSFAKSLRSTAEKLKFWRRLCEKLSETSFKPRVEDLVTAFGCLGTIPLDLEQAQNLLPLHAKFLGSLISYMEPKSIHTVMEQAFACNILHYNCSEVPQMWFKLCLDLLPVSLADSYEMWVLGKGKRLFINRSSEILKFELELAEALWKDGFLESAKILIEPICNLSRLNPELKALLLPLKENVFKQEFTRLEEKSSEDIGILFKKWRDLADRRSSAIKEVTINFIDYCEKYDVQTLLLILCHPTIRELFASDFKSILDPLYRLIMGSGSQIEAAVKLFFDYMDSFEKQQLREGLTNVYKSMRQHWVGREKLHESIRQGFKLHASTLIQCVPERLDCFYFLREINCHVSLDDPTWLLLVEEAKKEQDSLQMHKLISEFKGSGCTLPHLRPLIQLALSAIGSETLKRIREYAVWEGEEAQKNLASHLLAYLKSLDLKTSISIAIAEKKLLGALLAEDVLHSWIKKKIDTCCMSDPVAAIALGREFRIFWADSLLILAEMMIDPRYADFKQQIESFFKEALRGDFPLEGNSEIKAKCRFACFSLLKRSTPELFLGALRYLKNLKCIEGPQIFLQIFTSFASIAHHVHDAQSEIHELIVWAYREMFLKKMYSFEGNLCLPIILEGFGKAGTKQLLTLGYELLIFSAQTAQFDLEGSLSVKNFLTVLLKCDDSELQQRAKQLIREGLLHKIISDESLAQLWSIMIEHDVQNVITPALRKSSTCLNKSEEMELRQVLQDCLNGFKYILLSEYKFDAISNFAIVLACLNAKSEKKGVIWDYCLKYAVCLNKLYPNSPLGILKDEKGKLGIQLKRESTCPEEASIVIICYIRAFQKLGEESITMKFVSIQNRMLLVQFLSRWMQSFGPISKRLSEEFEVITQLRHALTPWIEQLSIKQVYEHLALVFPLFREDETSGTFEVTKAQDLFFQGLYMLLPQIFDPVKGRDFQATTQMRIEKLDSDPEARDLLRKSLTSLLLGLAEKNDPTALAFALLIFCYSQGFVFRDSFDAASQLLGNITNRFPACVLTNPSWNEEIALLETSIKALNQREFSKGFYSLQAWIFTILKRYREHLYQTAKIGKESEVISHCFYRLVYQFLQDILVVGKVYSRQVDSKNFYQYCNETIKILIDMDIWQCYKKNPMKYWKIVKRFVSICLKFFDNPECNPDQAKTIAKLLHTFFTQHTAGANKVLCPGPFDEFPLDIKVCNVRIACLHTIAERLLAFFAHGSANPMYVYLLVADYKGFTQSLELFPEALAEEKHKFLSLIQSYEGVESPSPKSAWYNFWS